MYTADRIIKQTFGSNICERRNSEAILDTDNSEKKNANAIDDPSA